MRKLTTERWAAAVPASMRAFPRWVGWRLEARNGKTTKVPVDLSTGAHAAVNDAATLGTFKQAVAFYMAHEADAEMGCGYVFTRGDGLVFVDLDHCLAKGEPKPWAAPLVAQLGVSYMEVSPSGTGLHAFYVGELPRSEGVTGARLPVEDGAVEVYAERRFSTVTGQRWGDATLGPASPSLPPALLAKLRRAGAAAEQPRESLDRRLEVWEALQAIDPDCGNEDWVTVGMSLKAAFGDAGLPLWRKWSSAGQKFHQGEPEARWASFKRGGVGLGSLFHLAKAGGWRPVQSDADDEAWDAPLTKLRTIPLSEVADEELSWLVHDLGLIRGYAALLAGDGGMGKSTLTLDVAARLSSGRPMPWEPADLHREPIRVLYMNAEDGAGDTVKPRARAAGADLTRLEVIDLQHGGLLPQLPDDVEELENYLADRPDVQLVIIDPLNAFLGREVDAHKAHDIRQALQPLRDALQRTGRCVWIVAHLNKNEAVSALYRVSGSADQANFVRSALLLGRDSDDEDTSHRILTPLKWNYGPQPSGREFCIVEASKDIGKVEWGEASDLSAEDVVRRARSEYTGGRVAEAEAWLKTLLSAGPMPSRAVEQAAQDAGFGKAVLNRAAKRMGLHRERTEEGWQWPQVQSFSEEKKQ